MIIDADCHISSQCWDFLSITAGDLVERMERAGIDRSLIWLKPVYNREIEPENEAVYQASRAFPGRFIPFGWTNPRLGKERALAIIRKCYEEYGLAGIKFNGAQDDYIIDDDRLSLPLIEAAAHYGKPIAFHIGADFYENTHPYRLRRIAGLFPETRFLMVHMGGAGKPPLVRAAIETAQACPNILLIGSAIEETWIMTALKALGPERICFGSDEPFGYNHVRLAMYRALLRDFGTAEQELVLGGNIQSFLTTNTCPGGRCQGHTKDSK